MSRKADCTTNGSAFDMCRQMAPPQNPLVSSSPSDEVRGMSSKMALASSPAPITWIGRLRPSFATSSGGKNPKTFAEPARIIMAAIKPCSTQPPINFQFLVAFMVHSPCFYPKKKTSFEITPEDRQPPPCH